MYDMSTRTRRKSWQNSRERVSLIARMAIQQEKVAQKLTELREQHGLTQEQASEKAGVAVRQWQRWEGAETMPYPKNLEKLAGAFGIPVSEFFDTPTALDTPDVNAALNGNSGELEERLAAVEKDVAEILKLLRELTGQAQGKKATRRGRPPGPQIRTQSTE